MPPRSSVWQTTDSGWPYKQRKDGTICLNNFEKHYKEGQFFTVYLRDYCSRTPVVLVWAGHDSQLHRRDSELPCLTVCSEAPFLQTNAVWDDSCLAVLAACQPFCEYVFLLFSTILRCLLLFGSTSAISSLTCKYRWICWVRLFQSI